MSWRYLSTSAHAKINWTLEVLGKRDDGYHEVRTIMQTIFVYDHIRIWPADDLSISVRWAKPNLRPMHREHPKRNLAFRAASLFRERAGVRRGAHLELTKRIPAAAGLGGGSSDAAAVLRCLCRLWQVQVDHDDLLSLAAELGSDVPFFLRGGTALASCRGEVVAQLPDVPEKRLLLALPAIDEPPDKTARMYAALRNEHFTDGSRTERLAERLRTGGDIHDDDLFNVFEAVLPEADPAAAEVFRSAAALGAERPHLAGSGPFFFSMLDAKPGPWTHGELRSVETAPGAALVKSDATMGSAIASVVREVP